MALALRIFLPFALTYLLAYMLRVVNAVAGEPIRADLGLSVADLGLLTSVYLAAFALCQIPFGVMMDRYGPRRVEAATLVLAAAGCAAFALASTYTELVAGRILMGVGASMCLMAPFTAYRKWFTMERLPFVIGLHMTFGAAGSALGGWPAEFVIEAVGWRGLFTLLGVLVVVAALSILLVVPSKREPSSGEGYAMMAKELVAVAKSRALWRLAPLSAISQAGYLSVVGLWTGPWLRDVAGLSADAAAWWLSATAFGLMAGFFGYGILVSRAEKSGRGFTVFLVGTVLYAIVTVGIIALPPQTAAPLWVLYAALGSGGVVTYGMIASDFRPELAGRVNTMLNFLVFFTAFLVQWGFGLVLQAFAGEDGAPPVIGYDVAIAILLGLQLAAYIPLLMKASGTSEAKAAGG
ncbi:MAG: MFS transporter [Pseudomonadota bacterium]